MVFGDKSLGFSERRDFTRINLFYTQMVNKATLDNNGGAWVGSALRGLWLEVWEVMNVVEKSFAPHCSSGLSKLKFHVLDHVMDDF